jgi:hypothetical protein|tara:strand:+ start:275 stop:1318 length:1044 start_codon:yes stop_codon:yes gene_type:complete
MIKIKNIIKENKIIMTEAFRAGKLRALSNEFRGNDSDFWSYGAKLGIEWDKITDKEIETNTKPKKKGIEIVYVDKDVTVPVKGKKSWYSGDNFGIDKFTMISVLKDGKPLWYTKGWKPITKVMTATGKTTDRRYSGSRSTIPDVTAGSRSYSRDKQFGMNMIGYQSLSGMMKIPGVKFHHINLDADQPYMGAGVKRQMRQAAQFGASKFTTNDEFKRINQQYFDELLKRKLNDPKKLQKKLKQAQTLTQNVMDAILGGKKATGKIKKLIDMKVGVSSSPEADAYRLVSSIGGKMARLYSEYGYYLTAIQKEKEDKVKYGTTDFARSEVESAAKDFQSYWNDIMQYKL